MSSRRCVVCGAIVPEPMDRCPMCLANLGGTEAESSEETERVYLWRLQRLLDAGLEVEDAETLAGRADVDVHRLVDLVHRGCPIETAIAIVA